jgi:hypothetical protein
MLIRHGNRRSFLKSTGVLMALPLMESLPGLRGMARAGVANGAVDRGDGGGVRRMVCIGNEFDMYSGAFWPKTEGASWESTELLSPVERHRKDVSIFGHLDHGLKGGHFAIHGFLTGVKSSDAKGMEDGGISVDQRAAEFVGSATRFPSLAVGSEDGLHGGCQMSWTRTGTRVPPIAGPRELFAALFVQESATTKAAAKDRIAMEGSILDAVLGDAKSLGRKLGKEDTEKLAEYFSSVRDVEMKLQMDERWQEVDKPRVEMGEPENKGLTRDLPAIYDLIALALETDSTRIATLEIGSGFGASDLGINQGYHSLSHHGKKPESIELLVQIEKYQMEQYGRFLDRLASVRESGTGERLLDRTMVLMGSGMGNANSHTNGDLPLVLAGGGFKHGAYKKYPEAKSKRVPLCNLYASMLQRFGVEVEKFGTGNGTLGGLEFV